MGRPSNNATERELARSVLSGSFAATGASPAANNIELAGIAHLTLSGTFVGTVVLERSFDGGTTWFPAFHTNGGAAISFTAPVCMPIACGDELGVLHRLNCTAYTSGTIAYRLSR